MRRRNETVFEGDGKAMKWTDHSSGMVQMLV